MLEYKNYYFKLAANLRGPLMSGLPLPNYDKATNTCIGIRFVDCDFHPDCADVNFVDCEFVACNPTDW